MAGSVEPHMQADGEIELLPLGKDSLPVVRLSEIDKS